jgi:hypothetical protein
MLKERPEFKGKMRQVLSSSTSLYGIIGDREK